MTKVRSKPADKRADKPSSPRFAGRRWDLCICLLLLAATLAVYSQVRHYDFVIYDDPQYVVDNSHVRAGLSAAGLLWALTSFDGANWFPLTWLSHMADSQFFGMDGGWHHVTNVWLHALNALLLFAVLKRMTGARWPSALVAFLFALHPLHVESVAWVAERKDVLSAFFWFLALWCYARYVERPGVGRYLAVVLAFGLGLMAKPMIVTLPFVLLLLDVWPLRRAQWPWRWNAGPGKGLLLEKLPLVAMAAGASVVTFVAQRSAGAVATLAGIPLPLRLANAVVSCAAYIRDMFWPTRLAFFYPYPMELPAWQVGAAALALLSITFVALRWLRRRPWFAIGWCWYLGTLAPVIGVVQVGSQSHADRYTYVPTIGLSIMLAWGLAELAGRWPRSRAAVAGLAAASCVACLYLTWVQTQYWEKSIVLFRHAIQVTDRNWVAHLNLGLVLSLMPGRLDDAMAEYREAIEDHRKTVHLGAGFWEGHLNLGMAYAQIPGRQADAIAEYRTALQMNPRSTVAHFGLGNAFQKLGRLEDAIVEYRAALGMKPDYPEARYELAYALAQIPGRVPEAIAACRELLRISPSDGPGRALLASLLAFQDSWRAAQVP